MGILVDNPEVIMHIIYHYNIAYASYMKKNRCLQVIFLQFPSDIPTSGRKKSTDNNYYFNECSNFTFTICKLKIHQKDPNFTLHRRNGGEKGLSKRDR